MATLLDNVKLVLCHGRKSKYFCFYHNAIQLEMKKKYFCSLKNQIVFAKT
jgi:hypothetical protein